MNEDKKKPESSQEAPAKDEGPKKPGNNKVMFLGLLAGVIVLNTVIAFVLVNMTRPKPIEDHTEQIHADSLKQAETASTTLGEIFPAAPIEIICNIAGTDGERFLKAAVQLEVEPPEGAEPKKAAGGHGGGHGGGGGGELDKWVPKIRDILLDHMSKLTLVEINEPEAKDKIRKDLLRLLNNAIPQKLGSVKEVLFTTFLIQ